jgi:RHS repeat-associated protein
VFLPSGEIMEINWDDAGSEISRVYLALDLRGGPEVITNASGNVLHRQKFSPFGAIDNPSWEQSNPAVKRVTRAFGGHEFDQETGLVNMGARLYDAKIGRFMSADLGVQVPSWTQAYNRYAYGWNNPMRWVDPSGLDAEAEGPEVVPDEYGLVVNPTPAPPSNDVAEPDGEPAGEPLEGAQATVSGPVDSGAPVPLIVPESVGRPSSPITPEQEWDAAKAGARNFAIDTYDALTRLPPDPFGLLGLARANVNKLRAPVPTDPRLQDQYNFMQNGLEFLSVAVTLPIGGEGAAAEGAAAAERGIVAADLGLTGKGITNLTGTVVNAGTTRIISVGNITATRGALVGQLRGALPNILNAARAEGVQTLQISASFANPGLAEFAAGQAAQYGGTFSSAAGQETLTFILGAP